jgi:hypothetical protein
MSKLRQFLPLGVAVLLISIGINMGTAQTSSMIISNEECYQSFEDFAYQGPLNVIEERAALPLPPWESDGTLPAQLVEEFAIDLSDVKIARSSNGHREIWLSPNYLKTDIEGYWIVYQPESQTWEIITNNIEVPGLYVAQLFVSSDSTLWGRTFRYPEREYPDNLSGISVLSRFNENTRRFELVNEISNPPLVLTHNYPGYRKFQMDDQDALWILAENDGIYRYDLATQTLITHVSVPNFNVEYAALAPDGSIYFSRPANQTPSTTKELFTLAEGMLFRFTPETGEVVELEIPENAWPIFAGLLVDHANRLWLGSIGYREPDGEWFLIHTHLEDYFEHAGDYLWAPPILMMESSDGRLWYKRYLDSDGVAEGTAWYNPATGNGCLFTNQVANIVEDSKQNMWLVADGHLYTYSLRP